MGVLDLFRKKKRSKDSTPAEKSPAYGWDAITSAFERAYPGQSNPAHRAPLVLRMHDISENAVAFDGISAYDAGDHWHFVTFGLTELYDKVNKNSEVSGFGYEFTFKLPRVSDSPAAWAFDFLEAIGKQVWKSEPFAAGHTIRTGPLDGRLTTRETAVVILPDPSIPQPLETHNGRVEFLLLVGVENEYRQRILAAHKDSGLSIDQGGALLEELRAKDSRFVTAIHTVGEWGEP
jgi:hypothetical protein